MAHSYQYLGVKRIVLIDCHNIPGTETRLITILEALKNAITLNGHIVDPEWTHFGLTVIRDNKCDVVLPIQAWESLSIVALTRAFTQIQDLLYEISAADETHLNKFLKKEYLLKGLDNAYNQFKTSFDTFPHKKTKQEKNPREILLITFNWDDHCKEQFQQYVEQHLKQDSAGAIKILDLACRRKFTINERLCIRSFQSLTFDIEVESFFKTWIAIRNKTVTITFRDSQHSLRGKFKNLHIHPYSLELYDGASDTGLYATARIPIPQTSQELFNGACQALVPEPSCANVEGWKALWNQLEDSNMALVLTSDNLIHASLLFPGQDYALILQSFAQDVTAAANLNYDQVVTPVISADVPTLETSIEFGACKLNKLQE